MKYARKIPNKLQLAKTYFRFILLSGIQLLSIFFLLAYRHLPTDLYSSGPQWFGTTMLSSYPSKFRYLPFSSCRDGQTCIIPYYLVLFLYTARPRRGYHRRPELEILVRIQRPLFAVPLYSGTPYNVTISQHAIYEVDN